MTQYNTDPNLTLGHWEYSPTVTGNSLTFSAEGGRFVSPSGTNRRVYIRLDDLRVNTGLTAIPNGVALVLNGLQVRRNTAASYGPSEIYAVRNTNNQSGYRDVFTPSPVGAFVTYRRLPNNPTESASASGQYVIKFPDNVPIDVTIKGGFVYDTNTAAGPAAVLTSADAAWTATLASNSRTISVLHNAANTKAFTTLTWNWGDGTSTQSNPHVGTNHFTAMTHTYAATGLYTVTATASAPDGQSVTSSQVLTVPSGTFTAGYTSQATYLNLDVDASSSVAPSNDPVDTYSWSWGDNTTNGSGELASHTYSQAGTYNVALTISTTETQRSHTTTKSVVITAAPNTDNYFTTTKNLLAVTFAPSITDGTSYLWNFGDGSPTETTQAVSHTYAVAGTYTVSLTVNGNLSTSQQVTVTSTYASIGKFSDALRLEVAVPQPVGAVFNRLRNPDGVKGAWGWVTPLAGSTIVGSSTSNKNIDKSIPGAKLIYQSSGSGTQVFYSEPAAVVAGQYVGAQFVCTYVDGYYKVCVEALNAAGTVIGTSAQTGYLSALGTAQRTTAYLLPALTVKARVRVNHYSNTSAGVPASGKLLQLRHVMLSTAATSGIVDVTPYAEYENWQDVLGPTVEITVKRDALDVGTMSATILDSGLDPATGNTLRPGQAVRIRVNTPDADGNSVWEDLYSGTLNEAAVTYIQNKGVPQVKDTQIVLSAFDNITRLSQQPESRGVALLTELPELLEGKGVPFEINGSSGQVGAVTVVAVNDNASVLDQIAITRDSNAGYAFIDRHDVFIARDPAHMPTVPVGLIDEAAYSGVDASFSVGDCMNAVTIRWLRHDPVTLETEEIVYGPYDDLVSQAEWGYRPVEFVMQGAVEDPAVIEAKAAAVLAANAVPERRINSVTMPIRHLEDLSPGKALLDLYDLVTLVYDRTGTSELARVTGVSHHITPKSWHMQLDFSPDGAVASPQLVPSPSLVVPTSALTQIRGNDAGIVWTASWGQYDNTGNALLYNKVGSVHTLGGAVRYTGSALSVPASAYTVATIGSDGFVPPDATVNVYCFSNAGTALRVLIDSAGALRTIKAPQAAYTFAQNDFFTFSATWIA